MHRPVPCCLLSDKKSGRPPSAPLPVNAGVARHLLRPDRPRRGGLRSSQTQPRTEYLLKWPRTERPVSPCFRSYKNQKEPLQRLQRGLCFVYNKSALHTHAAESALARSASRMSALQTALYKSPCLDQAVSKDLLHEPF